MGTPGDTGSVDEVLDRARGFCGRSWRDVRGDRVLGDSVNVERSVGILHGRMGQLYGKVLSHVCLLAVTQSVLGREGMLWASIDLAAPVCLLLFGYSVTVHGGHIMLRIVEVT